MFVHQASCTLICYNTTVHDCCDKHTSMKGRHHHQAHSSVPVVVLGHKRCWQVPLCVRMHAHIHTSPTFSEPRWRIGKFSFMLRAKEDSLDHCCPTSRKLWLGMEEVAQRKTHLCCSNCPSTTISQ